MTDPFWLSMGIPIEDTPSVVNHATSSTSSVWATVSSSITVVCGIIYKAYRIVKSENINLIE